MTRFWQMLAHYHGQTWNAAEPARSLGISEPTVRRSLDYLTQTFMVRQLQPWHENLAKRQVKAPKIYLRDTGLLHALLRIALEGLKLDALYVVPWPAPVCFGAPGRGSAPDGAAGMTS